MKKISRKVKASGLTRSSASPSSSGSPITLLEHKSEIHGSSLSTGKVSGRVGTVAMVVIEVSLPVCQVTPGELGEFEAWLAAAVCADHPYLLQVEATDVQPCLTFPNKEVGVAISR